MCTTAKVSKIAPENDKCARSQTRLKLVEKQLKNLLIVSKNLTKYYFLYMQQDLIPALLNFMFQMHLLEKHFDLANHLCTCISKLVY